MRALSDGDVQPENLRSARAVVKRLLRSASVSSVGGWTGKPSVVRGMPSVRDQGEGVAVERVVRPCRLLSDAEVSEGLSHPKKKSTPRLTDLANSFVVREAM